MPSSGSDCGLIGCKRKRIITTNSDEKTPHSSKRRPRSKSEHDSSPLTILSGFTLAISTLDVKGKKHSHQENSYKCISKVAKRLGAKVTGQVHKRISALVCTPTSLQNATQRVRKARQHNIPLVDVMWLHQCEKRRALIEWKDYELKNDDLLDSSENKTAICRAISVIDDVNLDTNETIPEAGWSEGVELGCCCVCHENGDEDCPWCVNCSVNAAKKKNK